MGKTVLDITTTVADVIHPSIGFVDLNVYVPRAVTVVVKLFGVEPPGVHV